MSTVQEAEGPWVRWHGSVGMGVPGREVKVRAENLVVLAISVMAVVKCPNRGNLRE